MPVKFTPPEICPICGEEVPRNAKACPECGADERTGWKEGAHEIGAVGAVEEKFDYDRFLNEEFGTPKQKTTMQWVWWAAAVILFIAFALTVLH